MAVNASRKRSFVVLSIFLIASLVAAIESNFPQREIADAAYEHQREIDRGERVIVGVNDYREGGDGELDILRIDPALEARPDLREIGEPRIDLGRDVPRLDQALAAEPNRLARSLVARDVAQRMTHPRLRDEVAGGIRVVDDVDLVCAVLGQRHLGAVGAGADVHGGGLAEAAGDRQQIGGRLAQAPVGVVDENEYFSHGFSVLPVSRRSLR